MHLTRTIVLSATFAASLALPGSALAVSGHTIKTKSGSVARIGAFHPSKDPTLGAAIRVFGMPTTMKAFSNDACQVDWRPIRLRILFANFSIANPCTPSGGLAQRFTVRSSKFRTWGGLRVGNRTSTIADKHPGARFREGSWWLRSAISIYGDPEEFAVVSAISRSGRVTAISGWIGAAGD